jgi:hypothetical protein
MLDAFRIGFTPDKILNISGSGKVPQYIEKIKKDISKVKEYYSGRIDRVSHNDTLYKILHAIGVEPTLTKFDVIDRCEYMIPKLVRLHNIASRVSYTDYDDRDIFIHTKSDYLRDIKYDNAVALKPLYSDHCSFTHPHPLDASYSFCFYTIDITLMALQYLDFCRVRNGSNLGYSEREFLYRYVYTNAICGMFNISLMNFYLFDASPFNVNLHPFYVTDYTDIFEEDKKLLLRKIKDKSATYDSVLHNIPSTHSTALEYMQVSFPYFNRYDTLPYFIIYGSLVMRLYDTLSRVSKKQFFSNTRGLKQFFLVAKSADVGKLECSLFEMDRDTIYSFFKNIKG